MRGRQYRRPRREKIRRSIEQDLKEGIGMFAHETHTRTWRIACLTAAAIAVVALQAVSVAGPAKTKQAAPATKAVTKPAPISVAPRSAGADLTLTSSTCATGTQLVVNIDLSNSSSTIVGGQFFLHYNTTYLSLAPDSPVGSNPVGVAPFTRRIYFATPAPGDIDLA